MEKPVTTCGMARNVQDYFLKSRPLTPGFIVREDGLSQVTDLPHFMKVLDRERTDLFFGRGNSTLRYEVGCGRKDDSNERRQCFP